MRPDSDTLNRFLALSWELHVLTGKSCLEIARSVLSTRTLLNLGYSDELPFTQEQADACIRLLSKWIRQAKERM